jgi:hypothetical protein
VPDAARRPEVRSGPSAVSITFRKKRDVEDAKVLMALKTS